VTCVADVLAGIHGGRVLDAGCGTGRFTRLLASGLSHVESVTGIDPDKDSIDEARRLTDDRRVRYRMLAVQDLDPEPERFDTVAMAYSLHHLTDPDAALARLVSVLAPGGALVVDEVRSDRLTPPQETSREVHHFKARVDTLRGLVHRRTMPAAHIRRLVSNTGLTVVGECEEAVQPEGTPERRVQEGLDFLEGYKAFAEELADRHALLECMDRLRERILAVGIQSPPHLLIVARKPGGG
jgi:SAM-dependent methyltransferase